MTVTKPDGASQPVHPTLTLAGVNIHLVDTKSTLQQIDRWLADRGEICRQICTVNPEFVVDAQSNPEFAAALTRADLRVPDGVGILLAARLHGRRLRERVTGSDGIHHICAHAAERGHSVFFLGAGPGVAEEVAYRMRARYPQLCVAGTAAGSPAEDEWPVIRAQLRAAKPDILFVAYGHPRQDLWIDRHRGELPAGVALGVGGAFDFVAGVTRRAPRWMQRMGLEWLHRLGQEPWRWRRMLKLPVFVWLVLYERLFQRGTSGG